MTAAYADRVAIVTGSTSGIGRITALEMAKQGAKILVVSNESKRILDALDEVRAYSPESQVYEMDVTSKPCQEEMVKYAMTTFGRIDILVNNAGITRDGLLMRMSDDDWDDVVAVNLSSVQRISRLVIRHMMKARFGRIVNVSSVVAFSGNAGQTNYAASKAGMVGFSKSLAKEVASRNITVNCVAPGFIRTPMTDKLKPEAQQAILAQIPMGAMGTPEDVAAAICFLASNAAAYITGETLHVNGGMYMA